MPLKEAECGKREEKFMQVDKQRREAKRKSTKKAMLDSYARRVLFSSGREPLPNGEEPK